MPTTGDKVAIATTATGGAMGATGGLLTLYGFTTSGIAAGSMAAGAQAAVGNVVAGSAFAAFQYLGAVGVIAGVGIGGGVVALGGGVYLLYRYMKKPTPRPKL